MGNVLFSSKETEIIIKALNSYKENPIPIGGKQPGDKLIDKLTKSAIQKLKSINALTSFSKDEFVMMAFAYRAEIESPTFIDVSSDMPFFVQLEEKLLKGARASYS